MKGEVYQKEGRDWQQKLVMFQDPNNPKKVTYLTRNRIMGDEWTPWKVGAYHVALYKTLKKWGKLVKVMTNKELEEVAQRQLETMGVIGKK